MVKPDYNKIKGPFSDKTKASDSEICWREFLISNYNFVNYCSYKVYEDEMSELLKSLQFWATKRDFKKYCEFDPSTKKWVEIKVNLGDIIFLDLGINFPHEASYSHPAVVVEFINNLLLVVPSSSNPDKIRDAYHPVDNETGKIIYRKVTKQDGFDSECVLELDKIRVVNPARIIKIQSQLNEDINNDDSLFNEIKNIIYQKYLPKQYINYRNLRDENVKLKEENNELIKKIHALEQLVKKMDVDTIEF